MSSDEKRGASSSSHANHSDIPSQPPQREKTSEQPFKIQHNMLMSSSGRPIIADEVDIPSPHTRHYHQLESQIHTMDDKAAQHFGQTFLTHMQQFNQHDTLDQARGQGRLVYRSWPKDPNARNAIAEPTGQKKYTSGFSSLAVSRHPQALEAAQDQFKQGVQSDPFTSAPATLLGKDPEHAENLWSGQGPGMVTSLLPEPYYVQMEAFHRRAEHANASPELKELSARMKSSITRPHLFENKDLSSGVMEAGGETGRMGKPAMRQMDPKADFKLRENATRYQSYMAAHGHQGPDIHNEMTMFYRQSGLYAPAIEMKDVQIQPMKSVPRKLAFLTIGQDQVPDGPPVTVRRAEDPSRDTSTLQQVLQTANKGHPVLKK